MLRWKVFPVTDTEEQGDEAITVDGSLMGGNGGGDIHSESTVTVRVQDSFHIFIQDDL